MANVIFIGRRNEYARKKRKKKYLFPAKKPKKSKMEKITISLNRLY